MLPVQQGGDSSEEEPGDCPSQAQLSASPGSSQRAAKSRKLPEHVLNPPKPPEKKPKEKRVLKLLVLLGQYQQSEQQTNLLI